VVGVREIGVCPHGMCLMNVSDSTSRCNLSIVAEIVDLLKCLLREIIKHHQLYAKILRIQTGRKN